MNVFKRVRWFFYFLVRPRWWLRNSPTSLVWDTWLDHALDNPKFEGGYGCYTITLNDREVWVENYPYAYAHERHASGLPKRSTAKRFEIAYAEWFKTQ